MKFITILGPTASGKTSLAIKMAKNFNGEIVNADSKILYRYLDIGTDKPLKSKKETLRFRSGQTVKRKKDEEYIVEGILHHLTDILEPDEEFSIAQYQKIASITIKDIQKRGKIPFLVGGSPLYIESVIYNYKIPKITPDKRLRDKLSKKSLDNLVKTLKKINPENFQFVDLKNKRRVIRAIEISLNKEKSLRKTNARKLSKNILVLGIKKDREELYKKINDRVDNMIKKGLVSEVKKIIKKYGKEAPALFGIGYRQIIQYLEGKILLDQAIELIKRDSRRFAKRQLTWFKRDKNIKWIESSAEARLLIENFLKS